MPSLTGNKPNQVPLNADLGNLAYQNASSIAGPVTVGGSVTANGVVSDTISEKTSATGVTIDSVLLKDNKVTANELTINSNNISADNSLGFRNRIINGGFSVAQRGTSFVSGANNDDTYNLDRWYVLSDGNDAVDITQATDVPTGAKYSIGLDVETANKKFGIAQIIENLNCFDAIGKTVTLSFQAKVSSTTKLDNVKCAIVAWSGTADTVTSDIISAWGAEGTNPTLIANATYENSPANLNVTTSWATYSVSAAVDTASTNNIIVFIWSDVTDTTAGDFLYITDVQLEVGSVATPFERRPYGAELALCQRYYYKVFPGAAGIMLSTGWGASTTTNLKAAGAFPVTMRTRPSALEQNGTANNYQVVVAGTGTTCSAVPTYDGATGADYWIVNGIVSSGLTAGNAGYLRTDATNGATAYLAWSAEL
jgi:hypothetical protein